MAEMAAKRTRSGRIQQGVSNMNKTKRSSHAHFKHVPNELIQHIQSLLPAKEAARTCLLSKSWRDAWSTIPTLRFPRMSRMPLGAYNSLIHTTLLRYHQHNLPIQSFHLESSVKSKKSASLLVDQWLRPLSSTHCLNELSLKLRAYVDSFALPDEIFCNEKLTTLSVINKNHSFTYSLSICRSINAVIKCMSLRVIEFHGVNIPENVLDNLLSTCSLLEKVHLVHCKGFMTAKIKNLRFLRDLKMVCLSDDHVLEVDGVPSLLWFHYSSKNKYLPSNVDSLGSVTRLYVEGVIIDQAFFEMIKSKFVLLERLDLFCYAGTKSFAIMSDSLKSLGLFVLLQPSVLINVQVYAPNLRNCDHDRHIRLSFPTIAPERVKTKWTKNYSLINIVN